MDAEKPVFSRKNQAALTLQSAEIVSTRGNAKRAEATDRGHFAAE
jgi:hypothetical protein